MLCNNCKKKEATCFIEKNINGKVTKYALCSDCAKKSGEFEFKPFSGMNFLGGLFGFPEISRELIRGDEKKCTLCGSTFDEIVNAGKVGCAECYKVFAEELSPTIRRIHGSRFHIGRKPGAIVSEHAPDKESGKVEDTGKAELKKLKKELGESIKCEDFEKAAELRDRIREIEKNRENA